MAVTTASYSQNPTYTATNFADKVKDALIASGHMTDWYDSTSNGALQHRVLEVVYDGSKTYGKTYYWFIFSGADMFMHVCTGWNVSSHIPAGQGGAGTIYEDWLSTTMSTTSNHLRISGAFNATQTLTIKRYTYGTFTVFLFVNGTTNFNLFIDRTAPLAAFIDLDREIYMGAMFARVRIVGYVALANFQSFPIRLKRTLLGRMMRGSIYNYGNDSSGSPPYSSAITQSESIVSNIVYGAVGNEIDNTANYATSNLHYIMLPNGFTNVNPSNTTNVLPPFEALLLSPYSALTLPVSGSGGEFIFYPIYSNNTLQVGATVVVSAAVEEYEIIAVVNSTAINTRPSMAICARTV